VADWLVGLACT